MAPGHVPAFPGRRDAALSSCEAGFACWGDGCPGGLCRALHLWGRVRLGLGTGGLHVPSPWTAGLGSGQGSPGTGPPPDRAKPGSAAGGATGLPAFHSVLDLSHLRGWSTEGLQAQGSSEPKQVLRTGVAADPFILCLPICDKQVTMLTQD